MSEKPEPSSLPSENTGIGATDSSSPVDSPSEPTADHCARDDSRTMSEAFPLETDSHPPFSDAHSTEQEPGAPAVVELSRHLEAVIEDGVGRILEVFEHKLAYDTSKQLQIDRLHDELQQHRSDLLARATRPLVLGMIRLHDDIGKLVSSLRGKPDEELSAERFYALLEGLREDIEIVLGQNGIVAYREPGGTFDPRRQRAMSKVSTGNQDLAGKVAESMRTGFEQGSEIIEKERIAIYDFVQQSSDPHDAAVLDSPEANASETGTNET